jgi:hypothetical protein
MVPWHGVQSVHNQDSLESKGAPAMDSQGIILLRAMGLALWLVTI